MAQLPSGTVTFLFTDVEGSTKLLHELGTERYAEALAGDLIGLGCALHGQGHDDEARRVVQKSIELSAPLGEKQLLARSFDALAATLADLEPERAAVLLGAAEALREEISVASETLSERRNPRTWSVLRHRLPAQSLRRSTELGRAKPDAALALALASID